MKAPKGYLMIDEFAREIGYSRMSVYRMIKKKEVGVAKIRKHKYISEKELRKFNGL